MGDLGGPSDVLRDAARCMCGVGLFISLIRVHCRAPFTPFSERGAFAVSIVDYVVLSLPALSFPSSLLPVPRPHNLSKHSPLSIPDTFTPHPIVHSLPPELKRTVDASSCHPSHGMHSLPTCLAFVPLFDCSELKKLQRLSLLQNPVQRVGQYRLFVIYKFPKLKHLDFNKVTQKVMSIPKRITQASTSSRDLSCLHAPTAQPRPIGFAS